MAATTLGGRSLVKAAKEERTRRAKARARGDGETRSRSSRCCGGVGALAKLGCPRGKDVLDKKNREEGKLFALGASVTKQEAASRRTRLVVCHAMTDSSEGDDWDEIDELMRELERTSEEREAQANAGTSSSKTAGSSSASAKERGPAEAGAEDDLGIWDSIDSLIRKDEEESGRRGRGSTTTRAMDGDGDKTAPAKEEEEEDLSKLTVTQLKEKLRVLGLPVSGRKAVLVERLESASSNMYNLDPTGVGGETSSSVGRGGGNVGDGGAAGLFSSWDDVQRSAEDSSSFDDWQGLAAGGNFDMNSLPMGRQFFSDPELEEVPVDPKLVPTSTHYIDKRLELEKQNPFEAARVPVDSEDLLKEYQALPEQYSWRGEPKNHPKFEENYQVFALSSEVEFLVKREAGQSPLGGGDDGRLLLDVSDIYMYHKPTGIYSVPELKGRGLPEDEGVFKEYYAYPVVSWYPGDALKNQPPQEEVSKIILVQVKTPEMQQRQISHEDGTLSLYYGEDFELSLDKTFVLDGVNFCVQGLKEGQEQLDYEACRNGKRGVVGSSAKWSSDPFPRPMVLRFNEGSLSEDGAQTFGLCVSEQEGVSLQRWELMKDVSELVDEATKVKKVGSDASIFLEKGSPFEFLGKTTRDEVEKEWEEFGLEKQGASDSQPHGQ